MKNILIVDDDTAIQDLFKLIFEKRGFHVTIESNPQNILKGNFELPDIFLLDRQLSGTDGLILCSYLKNSSVTRHIPVIMISASPDIAALSKSAGADNFVEKPFNIKDLVDMINSLIPDDTLI